MGKWGIWMGKIKEGGKGREEEKKEGLFICAVIFLISAITIGCGGYVDNNGNIVESSDAEQDSIFYQNKELTKFDVDVYQYFKKYERDYADMISFRKDLPGRVILIIDEGSPITPWDILDFKMKEDGSLEFEIVDKNKNGEIKLKEGDILMGWVDRFYIKSGRDLPPEYIRWVNFFGKVTSVVSDRNKRVLLVYTEPIDLGYVISRISLENIYLDWADIIEEANSPQAPKFDVVRVSSPLEAKSFKGKKRILLKFSGLSDCINYIKNQEVKYFTLPEIHSPLKFTFPKGVTGEFNITVIRGEEKWGGKRIRTNLIWTRGNVGIEFSKLKQVNSEAYLVRGGGKARFELGVEGTILFTKGKRECTALEVKTDPEKYLLYKAQLSSDPYYYESNFGYSDINTLAEYLSKEVKIFSFSEEHSGWGYNVTFYGELGLKIGGDIGIKGGEVSRAPILKIPLLAPILIIDGDVIIGFGINLWGEGKVRAEYNLHGKNPVRASRNLLMGKDSFQQYMTRNIKSAFNKQKADPIIRIKTINCNKLLQIATSDKSKIINEINNSWGYTAYRCQENLTKENYTKPSTGALLAEGGLGHLKGFLIGIDGVLTLGIRRVTGLSVGLGGGAFIGTLVKIKGLPIIQLFPKLSLPKPISNDGYVAVFTGPYLFLWIPVIEGKIGPINIDYRLRIASKLLPFITLAANSSGYEFELLGGLLLRKTDGDLGEWKYKYKEELKNQAETLSSDMMNYFKEKLKKK